MNLKMGEPMLTASFLSIQKRKRRGKRERAALKTALQKSKTSLISETEKPASSSPSLAQAASSSSNAAESALSLSKVAQSAPSLSNVAKSAPSLSRAVCPKPNTMSVGKLRTSVLNLALSVKDTFRYMWAHGFDFSEFDLNLWAPDHSRHENFPDIVDRVDTMQRDFALLEDNLTGFMSTCPSEEIDGIDYKRKLEHCRILQTPTEWFDDALVVQLIKHYMEVYKCKNIQLIDPTVLHSSCCVEVYHTTEKLIVPICDNSHWYIIFIDIILNFITYLDPMHHFPSAVLDKVIHRLASNCSSLTQFTKWEDTSCPFQRDRYSCGPLVVKCAQLYLSGKSEFFFLDTGSKLRAQFHNELFRKEPQPNIFSWVKVRTYEYEARLFWGINRQFTGTLPNSAVDTVARWGRHARAQEAEGSTLRAALTQKTTASKFREHIRAQLQELGVDDLPAITISSFERMLIAFAKQLEERQPNLLPLTDNIIITD